jgi:hypothetical protein
MVLESLIGITRILMSSRSIAQTGSHATVGASDLPERKRQELQSAIRTASRALGKSPENVPANARVFIINGDFQALPHQAVTSLRNQCTSNEVGHFSSRRFSRVFGMSVPPKEDTQCR